MNGYPKNYQKSVLTCTGFRGGNNFLKTMALYREKNLINNGNINLSLAYFIQEIRLAEHQGDT